MKKTLSIITLSVLVWGCAHKITPAAAGTTGTTPAVTAAAETPKPAETATPVTPAPASSPEMLGQATYTAKCGRCHGLKTTGDYTADRWVGIMQSMAPKARLDETEKQNVLAYVKANAKK